MEGTRQLDAVLATPGTRADTNGQRQLPEGSRPSLSETLLAMEQFQAMRDARVSSTRNQSHWILGNR